MTDTTTSNDKQAIALTYDGRNAPFVSAAGSEAVAAEILRIARDHEIPIYENPDLVNILSRLDIGDEIPETLYRTIAEIIAFVYMLKGKTPDGFTAQPAPLSLPAPMLDSDQAGAEEPQ